MDEQRQILKSAGGIGSATLASRILGYLRDMLIASHFGTGIFASAFFAAFRIPNLFRRLLGEGALSASFIPVFTDYLTKRGKEEAWHLAMAIFNLLLVILAGITLLGILASPFISKLIVPGFSPGKVELTAKLLRILFPYLFFIGLAALSMGILHSFKHFALPAIAPIILNLAMITSLLFLVKPGTEEGARVLALAVLAGGLGQLLIQIPVLIKKGMPAEVLSVFRHPEVKKVVFLMGPATLGLAVYQINIIIDTICGSFESIVGEGAIASLYYGNRVMQLPLAIFGIAMATAIFPTMAGQASRERIEELKKTLLFALRSVFFLVIPASVGLMVLGRRIISLLFERNAFDAVSTQSSASALFYYSIGLFAYAGVHIISRAFYSLQDTKTPVKVGCLAMGLNIIFNLILMRPLKLGGLALATSLSAIINLSVLLYILSRRTGGVNGKAIFNSLLRIVSASLLMGFICHLVAGAFIAESVMASLFQKCLAVFIPILVGIITFLLVSFSFRFEEANYLKRLILKRPINKSKC